MVTTEVFENLRNLQEILVQKYELEYLAQKEQQEKEADERIYREKICL